MIAETSKKRGNETVDHIVPNPHAKRTKVVKAPTKRVKDDSDRDEAAVPSAINKARKVAKPNEEDSVTDKSPACTLLGPRVNGATRDGKRIHVLGIGLGTVKGGSAGFASILFDGKTKPTTVETCKVGVLHDQKK